MNYNKLIQKYDSYWLDIQEFWNKQYYKQGMIDFYKLMTEIGVIADKNESKNKKLDDFLNYSSDDIVNYIYSDEEYEQILSAMKDQMKEECGFVPDLSYGENNFDLFGFLDKNERRCFEMLTSVSGIGPKAAMSILSHNTPEGLALAIMSNNEKALTVAPGIGKKIAQRVILELKDKVSKEVSSVDFSTPAMSPVASVSSSAVNDALTGLGVLGYSSAEIAPVLKKLDTGSMTAEQIIRAVLKQMVR